MFAYICQQCGVEDDYGEYQPIGSSRTGNCPLCGGRQVRAVSAVTVRPSMQEHFNATVGRPISSDSQFRSALARKSDELSERTGMDHKFSPVDMTDKKALGVTDEGLDTTARVRRKAGLDEPTRKIIA